MPELPDVEVFRHYLDATGLHQRISGVEVEDRNLLEGVTTRELKDAMVGKSFEATKRHGKYLFASLEGNAWLLLHFGMTGFLIYFSNQSREPAHPRLRVIFSNGYQFVYDCQRKLGQISLVKDVDAWIDEKGLGPDAMDEGWGQDGFVEVFSDLRGTIKGALMNQKRMAGIGNVYSDEILFQAGIDPRAKAKNLGEKQLRRIFRLMREEVLLTAIEKRADPSQFPESYVIPHRHKDGRCPKCSGPLSHERVAGRAAYFCPVCQKCF